MRFLLQEDADRLIAQAAAANVLQSDPDNRVARALCKRPHDHTTAMTTTIDEAGRQRREVNEPKTGRRVKARRSHRQGENPTPAYSDGCQAAPTQKAYFQRQRTSGAIGSFRIGDFITGVYDASWRIVGLVTWHRSRPPVFGRLRLVRQLQLRQSAAPGLESRFIFLDSNAVSYARNAIYDLTNLRQTQISFPPMGRSRPFRHPAFGRAFGDSHSRPCFGSRVSGRFWHEPADVTQLLRRPRLEGGRRLLKR